MKSMRRGAIFLLATLLFVAKSDLGHAQAPPTPSAIAADSSGEADELFRKGKAAFDAGRFEQAYSFHRAAWGLKQTYDIAGNLAQVELKLGKPREAAEHIAFALAHFPPSAQGSQIDRRDGMKKVLEGLRQQLGSIRIKVTPADARVAIDGNWLNRASAGDDIFLDPGTHTIEGELKGYQKETTTIHTVAGMNQDANLSLRPDEIKAPFVRPIASVTPPPSGSTPAPSDRTSLAIVGTGAGIGSAFIAGGVGTLIVSIGKGNDRASLREQVGSSSACWSGSLPVASKCTDLSEASAAERTFRGLAITGFAVGGAVLGATLGYALWPRSKSKQGGHLHVVPTLDVQSGGFVVLGTF
jgi:hypothetical protein